MTRLLLLFCILLGSQVYGEWLKVDTIELKQSTVYANPSTIRRDGNLVKMWALFDFKTERRLHGGAWVLSSKNEYEYECAEKRQRLLANIWYSDHMGSGEIVHTFRDEQPWQPVQPEGPEHSLWVTACTEP